MEQLVHFFELFKFYLFTPEGLQELIRTGGYIVLVAIVFSETGLFIGFFLPGDSLLFISGFVAGLGHLDFWTLNILLIAAAITGDTVGYWFGKKCGVALYSRPDTFFFRKAHLLHAKAFYEKHGGKTIVIARFVPFVRTFAPIVAGIAQMEYRRFLSFNVFGGIGWVLLMTTLGFQLGNIPWVRDNLEKAVIVVIFISVLPIVHETWKGLREKKGPSA